MHLDGFHMLINNSVHNRLGEEVTQPPTVSQQIPINCVPNISPICVIGSFELSNHIIYTASEFEKMKFIKIQVSFDVLYLSTYRYYSVALDKRISFVLFSLKCHTLFLLQMTGQIIIIKSIFL